MQELYTYKNDTPDSRPAASGPLSGKRVLVQPTMSVRGWLCNADSRALAGYTPLTDATVVARLIEAGAVLTGSSRMGELGFGLGANTTAALMADAQADVALVCDTLGEARLAAAGAGLFGFKPSYGRISRSGLIGLVPSMECCGFVAADPADILAVLGAIAGGTLMIPPCPMTVGPHSTPAPRAPHQPPARPGLLLKAWTCSMRRNAAPSRPAWHGLQPLA
jgi:aspartyl-tRNA(Asn)/glutamyl-tRNA(Gln) amidotransferase subunit A